MPLSLLNNNFYAPKNNKKIFFKPLIFVRNKNLFSFVLQKVLVLVSFHRFRDKKNFFLFSLIINFKFQINLVRQRERESVCVGCSTWSESERESVFVGGWVGVFIYSEREGKRECLCVLVGVSAWVERDRERRKKKLQRQLEIFFWLNPTVNSQPRPPDLKKRHQNRKFWLKTFGMNSKRGSSSFLNYLKSTLETSQRGWDIFRTKGLKVTRKVELRSSSSKKLIFSCLMMLSQIWIYNRGLRVRILLASRLVRL